MAFIQLESPVGRIEIQGDDQAVSGLVIERDGLLPGDGLKAESSPVLDLAAKQVEEYFAGDREDFELPLALGGTEFQRRVWARIAAIPAGSATTYGEIGREIGLGPAGRAIGGAVGANPVPLIIPCHRVLASNGKITGYSAGEGIATKRWLLEHEGVLLAAG